MKRLWFSILVPMIWPTLALAPQASARSIYDASNGRMASTVGPTTTRYYNDGDVDLQDFVALRVRFGQTGVGGGLRKIGGAQNSVGNPGGSLPWPYGTVVQSVVVGMLAALVLPLGLRAAGRPGLPAVLAGTRGPVERRQDVDIQGVCGEADGG